MLKLVLDTNTLVSAFFWKGNEHELFKRIEQGKAKLFVSDEIIEEVKYVINRPKFSDVIKISGQTPEQIIEKIVSVSHLVIGPKLKENVVKEDKKDDKFIECAVNAKADIIVSGDNHLLKIKEYEGIRIIKSADALELLK